MTTLLEKAKNFKVGTKPRTVIGKEEAELGVAWARSEVSITQVKKVTGKKNSNNVYTFLAISLREAVRLGKLK